MVSEKGCLYIFPIGSYVKLGSVLAAIFNLFTELVENYIYIAWIIFKI